MISRFCVITLPYLSGWICRHPALQVWNLYCTIMIARPSALPSPVDMSLQRQSGHVLFVAAIIAISLPCQRKPDCPRQQPRASCLPGAPCPRHSACSYPMAAEQADRPTTHPSFDFPDSNVTLCSPEGTLFRVHHANLVACSVTFRDMFHVGKPSDEIIQLSESSTTLARLLAMCYPAEDPPVDFSSLELKAVLDCYEAVVKYQMWVAGLALRGFVECVVPA